MDLRIGRRSAVSMMAWAVMAWACSVVSLPADDRSAGDPDQFFLEHVRPILEQRCWECHAEEVQESSLRLDSRQSLLAGGSSGRPMITVDAPATSFFLEVLTHEADVAMPPDEPLPESELETLTRWVLMGLPWPAEGEDSATPLTREELYERQRAEHWAFQPIASTSVPQVTRSDWPQQPVDYFILAHLERAGLAPSPEADRYTLIRRLKFDLLGLPPTYEEVESFVHDTSPDAYAQLVERYLASPHYGERWGRHWLDVARYADTRGYSFGQERRYPYSYTYRDYVIRAFNEDLPFDQFVREQLAADLLDVEENDPALAALGFLTVGRKFNNRHLDIDDQIDVVGRGLLGLTISCARCHDHKYDPIPTEDYYSLYGVLASSREPNDLPVIGDPSLLPGYDEFQSELGRLRSELESFKVNKRDELVTTAQRHAVDYVVRAISQASEESLQQLPYIQLKGEEFKPRLVDRWREYFQRHAREDHPVLAAMFELGLLADSDFAEQSTARLARLLERPEGTEPGQVNPIVKRALTESMPGSKLDFARVFGELLSATHVGAEGPEPAASGPEEDAAARAQVREILAGPRSLTDISVEQIVGLLTRAEGDQYRELERRIQAFQADSPHAPPRAMVVREGAQPHAPRVFIRGNPARPGKEVPRQFLLALHGIDRQPFQQGSGRRELAESIVDPANPLTARVIVNRVWMHHMGRPLVATPSDFGARSEPPPLLDVLDHLAERFMAAGWSFKDVQRAIVLSNTYRQRSLTRSDGDTVDPENALYWRMNPRRLEFEALRDAMLAVSGELNTTMGGRSEELTKEPYSLRRAVYGFVDRQDLPGLYRVFDVASPDQSCPERPRTTVPQQSLFMMNSPFVAQRASHMMRRDEVTGAGDDTTRIDILYRLIFGRLPDPTEQAIGERFVGQAIKPAETTSSADKWEQYAHLLLMSNAFLFID